MIRVMIDRKVKAGEDLSGLLVELRVAVLAHYPGYISGETLINTQNRSNIVVLSTWRSFEDWEQWANSEARTNLYERVEPFLQDKPEIRIFELV